VKARILNLGFPATHDLITQITALIDPVCISDFDAFAFDPQAIRGGIDPASYLRRQREIMDLLTRKGGAVICIVRQPHSLGFTAEPGRGADSMGILNAALPRALDRIRSSLREGSGSKVALVSGAQGASAGYYQVLRGALRFTAYLEAEIAGIETEGGTVFALDSVAHVVGVEFRVGAGSVCFVPVPEGVTGDRVGSAITRVVEAHYGGPREIEAPAWSSEIAVPGANAHDAKIAGLEDKKHEIETQISALLEKRDQLLNFRVLLYGYGKSVLEPVVRSAFRLLGFSVPEPDEYRGEWDVEMKEPDSSTSAIGEVEGSEGPVDVDKYRQLLDYVQNEALEGRDHKGILIGNGYRLTALDAPERQKQFSGHALNGAKRNGFCLLPTTELFKTVCAVLEQPDDEGLKLRIRNSILSTVAVWSFARETASVQAAGVSTSGHT